jgi:hypothetical protein
MKKALHPILKFLFYPLRFLMTFFVPTLFVRLQYRYIVGKKLNLDHPTSLTEKLQYLRLIAYPQDPLVIRCTDRHTLRDYVKELKLEKHLVPTFGTYTRFNDIPFSTLPRQYVMKCTHASGFNHIVLDAKQVNRFQLKRTFHRWLRTDYGRKTVEPHYSRIKRQIIIEQYLGVDTALPIEYKLHVFNGKVKYLYVVTGRGHDIRYTHFLADWTPLPGAQFNGWKSSDYTILQPKEFPKMVKLAETLASPFPFVRVDLYLVKGKIYISELTFIPAKGTLSLVDPSMDMIMGTWLNLNEKET